jgi:hypothetical protein
MVTLQSTAARVFWSLAIALLLLAALVVTPVAHGDDPSPICGCVECSGYTQGSDDYNTCCGNCTCSAQCSQYGQHGDPAYDDCYNNCWNQQFGLFRKPCLWAKKDCPGRWGCLFDTTCQVSGNECDCL